MKKILCILLLLPLFVIAQKSYRVTSLANIPAVQSGDSVLFERGRTYYGQLNTVAGVFYGDYGSGAKPIITGLQQQPSGEVTIVVYGGKLKAPARTPGYSTISGGNNSIIIGSIIGYYTGGEVVIRKNHWVIDKFRITSHEGNVISYNGSGYGIIPGYGYFVQNHPTLVKTSGDWSYHNNTFTGIGAFQIATLDNLVTAAANTTIKNIRFEGARKTLLTLSGANVKIEACDFAFANNAIYGQGNPGVQIINCSIEQIANNAIRLQSGCSNAIIRGNKVTDIGMIPGAGDNGDGAYFGINTEAGTDNVIIENNNLKRLGYVAIGFNGNGSIIRNNNIDSFCMVKDDGSGIYTYSASRIFFSQRRIVTNNTVTNGVGNKEGTTSSSTNVAGIYMDDRVSQVDITNNYVANCSWAGLYLHNANDIAITGNMVLDNVQGNKWAAAFTIFNDSPDLIRNLKVTGNKFIARNAVDAGNWLYNFRSTGVDIAQWGTFSNNTLSRPSFPSGYIFTHQPGVSDAIHSLDSWQRAGFDNGSTYTNIPAITPPIVMPVTWGDITYKDDVLTFITLEEKDNKGFEVEENGKVIATLTAKGAGAYTVKLPVEYKTTEPKQPVLCKWFGWGCKPSVKTRVNSRKQYRIKQIDIDGKFSYSKFITINR